MTKITVNKALYDLRRHVSSSYDDLLKKGQSTSRPRHHTADSCNRRDDSNHFGDYPNNTYSGSWFSGNFFHFDFSTHSTADKEKKTSKNTREPEQKGSKMGFMMLIALIAIMTGLMSYVVSFLFFRDWRYHSLETYEKRFARGTQRIQSIIEICFAFVCGAVAFKTAGSVLLWATVLSGMPAAVLVSSSIVKLVAFIFSGLSFYAGFIAGNSAVVSFLRWMFPLGTGTGRFRLDARYRQSLSQSKGESQYKALRVKSMIESLKSELDCSDRSWSLFIDRITALEAVAGNAKRLDLWALDNMVDALRSLKNILKKEEERAEGESTDNHPETLKKLREDLSSLIDLMKSRPDDGIAKDMINDCYQKFKDCLALPSASSTPDTVKIATGLAFKCLLRLEEIIKIGDSRESYSCPCDRPHHPKPEGSTCFSNRRWDKPSGKVDDPFASEGSRSCNSGEGKGSYTPGSFASSCYCGGI